MNYRRLVLQSPLIKNYFKMIKLLFIIILSDVILTPVYGQNDTEIAWYESYDGAVSGIDIPNAAALDDDFNLYIVGRSTGSGTGQDLLILKYSRDGELIDTIRYAKSGLWEEAYSIITDGQNNVFISGRTSFHGEGFIGIYQKYDTSGDLMWSHNMPGRPSQKNGIQLDSESNIVMSFVEADTMATFVKVDAETGNDSIWTKSYRLSGGYFDLVDMDIDQDDNLYALIVENYFCGTDVPCTASIVLKLSNMGELEWEYKKDNYRPNAFTSGKNGNIYVEGFNEGDQPILQKIDKSGKLLWENTFTFGFLTHDITDFAVDKHGNIVICYWGRISGSSFYYALEKHSGEGDTLWTNRYNYDETNFTVGSGLHIDIDNNIYVAGHNQGLQVFKFSEEGEILWTEKQEFQEGVSYDGNWIFTNDYDEVFVAGRMADSATGYNFLAMKINENIEVSTEPISDQIPNKIKLKPNYPNPFNPSTNIEYEVIKQGNVSVRVYDQMGRFVRELVKTSHSPGTYTVQFDAQNLSSGIYYYHLKTSGEDHIGKAILIK